MTQLPELYRNAILLCYVEGKTHREIAQQLGCPIGTISARLSRGHDLLRRQFAKRGLAFSASALATFLAGQNLAAALPAVIVEALVSAAVRYAAGGDTTNLVSPQAENLARSISRSMFMTKHVITIGVVALFALTCLVGGVTVSWSASATQRAFQLAPPEKNGHTETKNDFAFVRGVAWTLTEIDAKKRTMTVASEANALHSSTFWFDETGTIVGSPAGRITLERLPVAEKARIVINGKASRLADLRCGMPVSVQFAKDQVAVTRIEATWSAPTVEALDVAKRLVTTTVGGKQVTLRIAKKAKIRIIEVKRRDQGGYSINRLDGELGDLKHGMFLGLRLEKGAARRIVVTSITASVREGFPFLGGDDCSCPPKVPEPGRYDES